MDDRLLRRIHQTLGWLIGGFSVLLGVILLGHGQIIPGLIGLAMAIAVMPGLEVPVLVRSIVLVVAFLVL